MDSISQNDDTGEGNSCSQDINEIFINSLKNLADDDQYHEDEIEIYGSTQKSAFKNILQAKKRLQAFSPHKQIPTSPPAKNMIKNVFTDEKVQNDNELLENLIFPKTSPQKGKNPMGNDNDEVTKIEPLELTLTSIDDKLSSVLCKKRSRSKSSERGFVFRKREKKIRNYRRSDSSRRSPSPVISKPKREKPTEKSDTFKCPKNWEEFKKDKWTFGKLLPKIPHSSIRYNLKDISQQLLFETPADPIKPYFYKDEKGEEVLVPYQFLRYTSAKPRVSYNVNLNNFKENYLNREQILSKTNKKYKEILEKFLSRSTRTKFRTAEPIGQRNWYQRNWKDNESRVLETSIGLSFLQNYSDDDEDDEENELTFEPSKVTKTQRTSLGDKQSSITDKTSKVVYFKDIHKTEENTIIEKDKIPKMIGEEIKFYENKDVGSQSPLNTYKKKMNESVHSSLQELDSVRNRTESETFDQELAKTVDASWTPERIEQISDTMWDETPKRKKEKLIDENRKIKHKVDSNCENIEEKQRAREIHSNDEWDETPKQKKEKSILEEGNSKKSKKKQSRKISETDSSSDERQIVKRKKKKMDKRKQKEKLRKARKKKEKIKAEKLKLKKEKKRRQKEKAKELVEKEILQKLKKEIEQNLEEVEREEREKENIKKAETIIQKSIKVKIEKEEDFKKHVRPPEDLRNYLDKKTGKAKDVKEKFKKQKEKDKEPINNVKTEISSMAVIEIKEQFNTEIKQEKLSNEDKKVNCDVDNKSVEEVFQLEKENGEEPCEMKMFSDNIKIVASEMKQNSDDISKGNEIEIEEEKLSNKINSKEELARETTPDTDEYHSNWESDDGVSSVVKTPSKKRRNAWESDEELFDRNYLEKKELNSGLSSESAVLEMPLHLKKFSRRRRNSKLSSGRQRPRSPEYLDVDNEIKLLEAERINLSKERMQLEIEKIRIRELEREKSIVDEYIGEPSLPSNWQSENFKKKQNRRHSRWDLREDHVDSSTSRNKMEKLDSQGSRSIEKENDAVQGDQNEKSSALPKSADASLTTNVILSIPSSPEITSTESPKPTVLESAYQEFIRAVSTGDDSKEYLVISSADSDTLNANCNKSTVQKKTKLTRSQRDSNREKCAKGIETTLEGKPHGITDPNMLRDILLPGECPVEEIPMPVPSPKLEVIQNLPSTLVMNAISALSVKDSNSEVNTSLDSHESFGKISEHLPKKPFSFSTLILPSKKPVLLEKSNWKLDDDSDEEPPPLKKKLEDLKIDQESVSPVLKQNTKTIEHRSKTEEVNETSGTTAIDKKEKSIVEKIEITRDFKNKVKDRDAEDNKDKKKDIEDNRKVVEDIRKYGEDKEKYVEEQWNDAEDKKINVDDKRKNAEDRKKGDDIKRKVTEDSRKDDRSSRRRYSSRSQTPPDVHKDKRRRDEDARRKDEDQRRKDEDARRRTEDARRKDEDTKRTDHDKRRKEDENKRRDSDNRKREVDVRKKEDESKRRERDKRPLSPQRRRESSPRRRRNSSPVQRRSSPRHRSPLRRQESLRRGDRRSPLPSRFSPTRRKRSHSPNRRSTATRRSSCSNEKSPRPHHHSRRSKSPRHSPMDGLKRSLADSTISDDLLPQPCLGEVSDSPLSSSTPAPIPKKARVTFSPKRPSLDDRINQVLGVETQPEMSWKVEEPQKYLQPHDVLYPEYYQQRETSLAMGCSTSSMPAPITSKVVQVGNILQVVPTEEISLPPRPQFPPAQKIVQVGNMLQIVPSEMDVILPPLPPPPPPNEMQPHESNPIGITLPEKQSAEAILAAKNAERLAERAKKRKEKEERKKEKERKKKEREKRRKMQLRISTEEVIKRALEMEGLIIDENEDLSALVPEIISDTPGLDPTKSILSNSTSRCLDPATKSERGKSVQFADGVRPGEGTSPSGGEELSSPPPLTEDLPKTKRYRKMETKRRKKRKIKVKVVKRRQSTPDSDQEYENLPPPSPPPGSPPPHVFPPRVKVHTINNIPQHYLPSFGITTAPQQPMMGQAPHVMNMGYPTASGAVYRPAQQSHVNVIGQHYARSGHAQNVGGHMHASPQLVHPQITPGMTHREHQPFGSF